MEGRPGERRCGRNRLERERRKGIWLRHPGVGRDGQIETSGRVETNLLVKYFGNLKKIRREYGVSGGEDIGESRITH